ncbi:MAG: hypothetical protein JWL82_394 [Parcubacteria group bacterium]|nr:hypothetical protein [Parcubacteria group bacterium]
MHSLADWFPRQSDNPLEWLIFIPMALTLVGTLFLTAETGYIGLSLLKAKRRLAVGLALMPFTYAVFPWKELLHSHPWSIGKVLTVSGAVYFVFGLASLSLYVFQVRIWNSAKK